MSKGSHFGSCSLSSTTTDSTPCNLRTIFMSLTQLGTSLEHKCTAEINNELVYERVRAIIPQITRELQMMSNFCIVFNVSAILMPHDENDQSMIFKRLGLLHRPIWSSYPNVFMHKVLIPIPIHQIAQNMKA